MKTIWTTATVDGEFVIVEVQLCPRIEDDRALATLDEQAPSSRLRGPGLRKAHPRLVGALALPVAAS